MALGSGGQEERDSGERETKDSTHPSPSTPPHTLGDIGGGDQVGVVGEGASPAPRLVLVSNSAGHDLISQNAFINQF